MIALKLKMKRCKACREEFSPMNSMQVACSTGCAIVIAREATAKIERKALAERKAGLKTRAQWMREAQAAFNAYIRERDRDLPCISCGRFHPGAYDAGHYRSAKASPEIRFDEDNCHRQCVPCNQHLSGNIFNYRIGLLMRMGEERVAILEGPHEPKKYTINDLKAIKVEYRLKLKGLATKPYYPI